MATLSFLASLVGGTVRGDGSWEVEAVAPLSSAGPRQVSFFTHAKYRDEVECTTAGAVIITAAGADQIPAVTANLILCEDPYLAMAKIANHLHPTAASPAGIAKGAQVDREASVDPSAHIEAAACVARGAKIGPRTVIHATAYVGPDATVGADCVLHPGARLLHHCRLGDRVILHAGVVVGSDGFGYAPDPEGHRHKIPQLGIAVIESDVEIGANSTVDRATFGETRVGRGSKIDNLVQIAHNVVLGQDCVVVSQSGIAGSTKVGDRVTMGAQTGMVGHLRITDDVVLGGRGAFGQDVARPGIYSGAPAFAHAQWLRASAWFKRLPELARRVRALERAQGETRGPQREKE